MTDNTKKYKTWEPLLLSIMVVIGMIAGAKLVGPGSGIGRQDATISKSNYNGRQVEEIIRFLETRYVSDISSDSLIDKAIVAIMAGLDPHTHYFPPDEIEALEERTGGHYVGIGVEIAFIRDSLMVLYPKKNSPAERARLHPGDFIVAVDGKPITGDTIEKQEILDLIRGVKGTKVELTIKPMLERATKKVEMTRDEIEVPSVTSAYMIDSVTAFIKIQRFTTSTYKEFMDQVERLVTKENAEHLVIDLRDNPGGFLKEAVNMLSQLIADEGKILVYTEGIHQKRIEYKSTGKIFFPVNHIAVLINEGSASASEIIAGCLQDHDRGIIVGTRSYGKGLVQEQFDLSNGGVLRMTVSKYYTPSGRLIQKAYDKESLTDTTSVFRTSQGRPVYAGGGIQPDIVVADAIDWADPMQMEWMDIISQYAIRHYLLHQDGMSSSTDAMEAIKREVPSRDSVFHQLLSISATYPASKRDSLDAFFDDHKEELYELTGATLAAYRAGEEGWYMYFNEKDPVVRKAVEMVQLDPQLALQNK